MRGRGQGGPGPDGAGKPGLLQAEPRPLSIPAVSQQEGRGPRQPTPVSQMHPKKQVFPVEAGSGVQAGTVRYCELMAGSLQNGQCFDRGAGGVGLSRWSGGW